MGCVVSKKAVSVTPVVDSSGVLRDRRQGSGGTSVYSSSRRHRAGVERLEEEEEEGNRREPGDSGKVSVKSTSSRIFRLGSLPRSVQGEQIAAGWPAWLSAVAGEAIQGWVPRHSDSFEKLEKAEVLGIDPREVNVPVVGGHSGVTILPLLLQVNPACSFTTEEIRYLTDRIQNGGTEVREVQMQY